MQGLWAFGGDNLDEFNYLALIDSEGEFLMGEYLGSFEERWFWESEAKNKYIALWSFNAGGPKISFINESGIISKIRIKSKRSSYLKFIKEKDLFLKGSPLKGLSFVAEGNTGHHLFENMFGNYAWDLVKNENNQSYVNNGVNLEDHYVWSEKVFSNISGKVVDLARSEIDNPADPLFVSDLSKKKVEILFF